MRLDEVQDILNTIYTDEGLRNSFFSNRQHFLRKRNIEGGEALAFFDQLNQEQVEFFASTPFHKRKRSVEHLLPCSMKLLGEKHLTLYKDFSQQFKTNGIHKHHEEALAYCEYLLYLRMGDRQLRHVLRFEKQVLENFLNPASLVIMLFPFNPLLSEVNCSDAKRNNLFFGRWKFTMVIWRYGKITKTISF